MPRRQKATNEPMGIQTVIFRTILNRRGVEQMFSASFSSRIVMRV
jgi:hypothetical protein